MKILVDGSDQKTPKESGIESLPDFIQDKYYKDNEPDHNRIEKPNSSKEVVQGLDNIDEVIDGPPEKEVDKALSKNKSKDTMYLIIAFVFVVLIIGIMFYKNLKNGKSTD